MACSSNCKSQRGFTLIELLITLGILSVLGLSVVQAIRRAIQNKKRIEMLNEHQSVLRDAMDVMVRDINLAFHYRDFNKEIEDAAKKKMAEIEKKKKKGKKKDPDAPPELIPQVDPEEETKDTGTHFNGKSDELNFVSLNLPRIRKNQKTADYAEVGYRLERCKSRSDRKRETKCIIRRINPYVDDDVTKGGIDVPLLEDVTKLEFSYYGLGKLDWVKDWKTYETSDPVTLNRYPELIKVRYEVAIPIGKEGKTKKYKRERIVPIMFVNNPPEDEMDDEFDDDDLDDEFLDSQEGEDAIIHDDEDQ